MNRLKIPNKKGTARRVNQRTGIPKREAGGGGNLEWKLQIIWEASFLFQTERGENANAIAICRERNLGGAMKILSTQAGRRRV